MAELQALYLLDANAFELTYGAAERLDISRIVNVYADPQTRSSVLQNPQVLSRADVIFSGWGAPVLDAEFLSAAPKLKAIFYGGGAMGSVLTPAVWERGIAVSSAIEANAVPVAEYALSTILFSLKHGWRLARQTREQRRFVERDTAPGCYGTTVGVISLGVIGRALLRLLKPFSLRVIVYDPFLTASEAAALGVESVTLDELFEKSDAVTLHTPHLPETEGLITGRHLSRMKQGATFINTARGEVVRQDGLIEVAQRRDDLQFVLDVANPEPPEADSPLYTLANVMLTPHIAGSVGAECRRMGRWMVQELERFVNGQPLKWAVRPEHVHHTSHRPMLQVKVTKAKRLAAHLPVKAGD
jgi:phosphoglycerate dehydrogenase-like enzyme